jgi:hypothetical protein
MTPYGVHGMKRGWPCIRAPMFSAWKPSTSFAGAIAFSTASLSKCFGSGNCTRMPWIAGSALSSASLSKTTLRLDVRRVGDLLRVEAGLRTGVDLVAHIDLRRRVFTDEDHRQSGAGAARGQRFGTRLEIGAQPLRQRVAVEDSCGHRGFFR